MGKKKKPEDETAQKTAAPDKEKEEAVKEEAAKEEPTEEVKAEPAEPEQASMEQYLRLAAEYDNFRKRSQREKDAIYHDAVANTAKKLLPVYDNLERALKTETSDEAFRKGVEMTMTELTKIMDGMGIKPFGAAGEPFDPQKHNAVMHVDDASLGENVIAEVFQTGFTMGDRVIRFAMVKVAN